MSYVEPLRMLATTEPVPIPTACHDGWSVECLLTGITPLSERRLCIIGCCLGGGWFRPPTDFSDQMVILLLLPKKSPQHHYSIVDIPFEKSKSKTWYADWNMEIVTVYRNLVRHLFSLGVSSQSPVFVGVSAGILSTMVLLTSLMNDTTVQMTTPMAVFISGAWHPKAHPEFREAVESSAPCARPQVFVANHSKDWHCSWSEQEAFWNHVDENYSNLLLVVLNYEGSAAAELFDGNYHDVGSRIAASTHFWKCLLDKNFDRAELRTLASVACDYNMITRQEPFTGYARSLGLRLLCRLWRHMYTPNLEQHDWFSQLVARMHQCCGKDCLQMFHQNCLAEWPTCLGTPRLGEYFIPQLCDSFANSLRDGRLQSKIDDVPVSLEHLHHSEDMELVEVKFIIKSKWLSTRWKQVEGRWMEEDTIIFTHPCFIVFRFSSGPCLTGFYYSHVKHKNGKRRADGTRVFYPHFLKSLVLACTPKTFRDCGTKIRTCTGIEVIKLTHDFSSRQRVSSMDR